MNRWSLIALLLGLLLVAAPFAKQQFAAADEYGDDEDEDEGAKDDEEKDVIVLTTSNFDSIVKKSKFALVEFYAPWCGHCKTLKPHYAKAATIIKGVDPEIVIAKVDATAESELGTKFEVQGYPTLKWFVDGKLASDYNGGRDTEGIVNWIKKKTGPVAIDVDSVEKLSEVEAEHPVVVVGYFTALEGPAYDVFKGVAQKTEDVAFVQTVSAEVAKAAGVEAADKIVVLKNFVGEAREVVPLTADLDSDSLSTFIKGEKLPLTIEFNQQNSDKIFNSGINKQLILWSKASDLSGDADVIKAYREVSKSFKGQLVFVTVNSESESAEPVTNFFGLKDAAGPVVIGFYMEKNKKYKMAGAFSQEALAEFAAAVIAGTAPSEYKSAPIPEDNDDGGVKIVVGKTVDSIVKDKTKDVLLEVYAPWCGHCKKLEPTYKKLAKRFAKVNSVVIAKMDGTENEHADIDAKGFPTILFFPAGENQAPISFEGGDRSLKALTKFIKQHAAMPYELPKKSSSEKDEL